MRASRLIPAAFAATSLAALAIATPALAAGPGSSVLSVAVVVPSTLSIVPSAGSISLIGVPGSTVDAPSFTINLGSNDEIGAQLTASISQQVGSLTDTDWSIDNWAVPNGQPVNAFAKTVLPFNATGDALVLYSTAGPTGGLPTGSSASPHSDAAHTVDIFTSVEHLTLPANQPGSPQSGYRGAMTFLLTGN